MKEKLIEKLLKEQTTPEEEHLIAQMLHQKGQEDTDLWLVEDETETYDRLVTQRHSHRQMVRWAVAAVLTVIVAAGAIVLWPHHEGTADRDTIAVHKTKEEPAAPVTPAPVVTQKSAPTRVKAKAMPTPKAVNTADSLQYYITRLEQELAHVTDSTYTAKAEQIIRADARLQRLVRRIMVGEIERNGQPVEAMVNNEGKEDLP